VNQVSLPPQIFTWLLSTVIGLIFGAGGAWAVFQRMRKDLNGIGAVQRRDRWNSMLALMVIHEKREDRQRLADLLRQQ
jgi:hypothetical protein